MHEMRTTAIDDPGVRQSLMRSCCGKNVAKRVDVLFGVQTPEDPRNIPSPKARRRGFDAAFAKLLWAAVSAGLSLVVLLAIEKPYMCISGHFEQIKLID